MSEIVAGADNMPLGMSDRLKPIHAAVRDMIRNEIMPLDEEYLSEVGKAEGGFSSDPAADEFRSLVPNVALLENIAQKTGGQVVAAADLEDFVKKLPNLHAPVMETWSYPLWHTPAMFAFALACLLLEWGVRRFKGMP